MKLVECCEHFLFVGGSRPDQISSVRWVGIQCWFLQRRKEGKSIRDVLENHMKGEW